MKREALRAQSLKKRQAKVVANLRAQQQKLLASRDSLIAKLDMIMGPKRESAETRIQQEQAAVDDAAQSESTWSTKAGSMKELAMSAVKTRDEAQAAVKATEKKLAEIQAELVKGEEIYRRAKMSLRSKVEAARFAAAELRGASDRKKETEAALEGAVSAKKDVEQIYAAEVAHIDEALAQGQANLQKKSKEAAAIAQEAEHASLVLKERHERWKEEQRRDEDEASQAQQKYQELLDGYEIRRRTLLGQAEQRAVTTAEARPGQLNGNGDWAWDGSADDGDGLDS